MPGVPPQRLVRIFGHNERANLVELPDPTLVTELPDEVSHLFTKPMSWPTDRTEQELFASEDDDMTDRLGRSGRQARSRILGNRNLGRLPERREDSMRILTCSSRVCLLAGMTISLLSSGCAINMKVPIKDPAPSTAQYVKPAALTPVALSFTDARTPENKEKPVTGRIPMQLTSPDGKPFDPFPWVADNTVKELIARGLPVQMAKDGSGPNTVVIKLIQIENRRVSGFSPFETFTSLKADVVTGKGTQRVAVFIKRGKVPVMSWDEVIGPTYNDPLDLVAKELAAKLNQILFNAKLSDQQVDALIAKTNAQPVNYRDVHELGFSNNPRAIPQLVKLTASEDDEVRQAAYSALGVLRASDQFDLLVKEAENTKDDWEDRATALKAIGDLGTPKSREYLEKERGRVAKLTDAESVRTNGLISLYLD